MKITGLIAGLMLCFGGIVAFAQEPAAAARGTDDGHALLKMDEGVWNAKISMFMGPTPDVSEGREVNRLVGEYWLVSDFRGQIMGADFVGHGTFGFDEETGKHVGSWVDSMSPHAMHMMGTWDPATRTMSMESSGKGPDGAPVKGKSTVVYSEDFQTRTMTMFSQMPGSDEMTKTMEILYTKVKE